MERMRHATLLLPLLLAACATAPQSGGATRADRIDAEKLASWNGLKQCLYDTAARVDDGSEDAPTVAAQVAPLCALQFDRFETSFTLANPAYAANFHARQAPKRVTHALNMVLKHRQDYSRDLRNQSASSGAPTPTGI